MLQNRKLVDFARQEGVHLTSPDWDWAEGQAMRAKAVIVMGVSGSGKTTLGAALAGHLGWAFADADDYHPQVNRDKMARGEPLNDADRAPWLAILHTLLAGHLREGKPVVLACSALKQKYRDTLTDGLDGVTLVYAHGCQELIAQRMRNRSAGGHHFMPVRLLDSQFAALEPPLNAIYADISRPITELMPLIVEQL